MLQHFVKSFSNGQITIPKNFREKLNLGKTFWLRLILEKDKLVAEPIYGEKKGWGYAKKLLEVNGDWFKISDWEDTRKEIDKRLARVKIV